MNYIIAADEVGRGCLAGPLCVGAILVPEDMDRPVGVDDSKKLSASKRADVFARLVDLQQVVVLADNMQIDREGMSSCLRTSFEKAIRELVQKARVEGWSISEARIDGSPMPWSFPVPVQFIVKGDALDWRIGAASIIAKVTRDRLMEKAALEYPGYGWETNMGYGSKAHQNAISNLGLTPLHRATFCRRFVREQPTSRVGPDEAGNLLDFLNGI